MILQYEVAYGLEIQSFKVHSIRGVDFNGSYCP